MDLAEEFKKLQERQDLILQMLKQSKIEKEDLKVYSLDKLAEFFGVTKRTIYNWKDEGKLPLTIIGSKSYMTEAQLQEFLTTNTVKSGRRFSW